MAGLFAALITNAFGFAPLINVAMLVTPLAIVMQRFAICDRSQRSRQWWVWSCALVVLGLIQGADLLSALT
jgi:hypothetical protein